MSFQFCPECGTRYAELASPRVCGACGHVHWFDPKPSGILLVQNQLQSGLLVIERNEAEGHRLGLPGGPLVEGETWQAGGARQLRLETGYVVDPAKVAHVETVSSPDGRNLLVFGHATVTGLAPGPTDTSVRSKRFVPWAEMYSVSEQLRNPLHTAAIQRYLQMRSRRRRQGDR